MSEFIRLTGSTAGKTIMVPKSRIMSIAAGDECTEVFVEGMSQVYTILPWHVKETPEEIMALIEGTTKEEDSRVFPFCCPHCGDEEYQILTDYKGVSCTLCKKYILYDNGHEFKPAEIRADTFPVPTSGADDCKAPQTR